MSTWKGKALELLPELKHRLVAINDRHALWVEVKREFNAAKIFR
jgi:hypothetical protein